MLEFALDNLPVFVNVQRPSSACERVILSPLTRSAIVQGRSAGVSSFIIPTAEDYVDLHGFSLVWYVVSLQGQGSASRGLVPLPQVTLSV